MANSNPYQTNPGYYPMYPMQQMPTSPQGQNPNLYQPQPMQMASPTAGTKGGVNVPGMLPIEESYIENILRLNKGTKGNSSMFIQHLKTIGNGTQKSSEVLLRRQEGIILY